MITASRDGILQDMEDVYDTFFTPSVETLGKLEIKRAVWGYGSNQSDVTQTLRDFIVDESMLQVQASIQNFDDPAKGWRKRLHVTYAYKGRPDVIEVPERQMLILPKPKTISA